MTRYCAVNGCGRALSRQHWICRRCWMLVPVPTRLAYADHAEMYARAEASKSELAPFLLFSWTVVQETVIVEAFEERQERRRFRALGEAAAA